jgi:hypothetical protein
MKNTETPAYKTERPVPVGSGAWLDRIEEINAIVEPLLAELAELEQKIIESKSVFKVGDVIEWRGNRKGRVIRIKEWLSDEPMWVVKRILKTGGEGEECEVRPYMNAVRSNVPDQRPPNNTKI